MKDVINESGLNGSGAKPASSMRAGSDARGTGDSPNTIPEGRHLCIFWLGTECYALDVAFVSEAVTIPLVRPVPAAPKELLGMVNLRGTALAVADLALVLALPNNERAKPSERGAMTVLILSPSLLHAGLRIGRVDSVLPYQRSQVCTVNEQADHPAVSGVLRLEGRGSGVTILNGNYLLDRLKSTRDSLRQPRVSRTGVAALAMQD